MRVRWTLMLSAALVFGLVAVACADEDTGGGDVTATATASEDHDDAAVEIGPDTVLHHWGALSAINAGDIEDARDHVQHILDAVTADETHAAAMRDVMAAIEASDLEAAEHGIEGMLAGRAEPGLTIEALHLQMALVALQADDTDDARHHVEHVAALAGDDDGDISQLMGFLDEGDHTEASEHLAMMIEAHGGEAPAGMTEMGHESSLEADREVTVVMTEFAFEPSEIEAKVGEHVRLVVINRGAVLHDITAEEFHGEVETVGAAVSHESTGGHGHADEATFHAAANAGDTAELVFEASEPGEYTLFCTVPGHRDLGMTATLVVAP